MKQNLLIVSLIFISQLAFSQVEDCKCFNGISSNGSENPSLTINFSNEINLSICGYEEEKKSETEVIISEFDVFNCNTGESLITFGALQPCDVIVKPDTIVIKHLAPLPTGNSWKWQLTSVTQQLIFPKNNNTIITNPTCIYVKTEIEQSQIDQFYSELEQLKGKGYNDDLENLIAKLGVLTLNGDTKARNILNNFRLYIGYALDGSTSELWNQVTSITNFECKTDN